MDERTEKARCEAAARLAVGSDYEHEMRVVNVILFERVNAREELRVLHKLVVAALKSAIINDDAACNELVMALPEGWDK
jgi:hypothetical protein